MAARAAQKDVPTPRDGSPQQERVRLPIQGELVSAPAPAESSTGERLLQVGDLAQASGKTVRAIHLYEELGLLKPDRRSKGRYRLYDPHAVTRVRWIGKLHELGMSLTQIREVVSQWEGSPSPGSAMSKVRRTYAEKLAETREQIARLTSLERELEKSIDYLDTCERCDSPNPTPLDLASSKHESCGDEESATRECASCAKREKQHASEPELVAGIHHMPFSPKINASIPK